MTRRLLEVDALVSEFKNFWFSECLGHSPTFSELPSGDSEVLRGSSNGEHKKRRPPVHQLYVEESIIHLSSLYASPVPPVVINF